ncbi:AAA family ATPase [candidate division KSB1 bacterium]|nr:AAA family ATPase [candidate division KSB1 bacterium]
MKLRYFHIQNYKNLQDVLQEDISDLHTFIGRNSSGKTSIFEAINLLKQLNEILSTSSEIISGGIDEFEFKTIKLELVFEISETSRKNYLTHFFQLEESDADNVMLNTDFLEKVKLFLAIRVYGNKHANKQFENIITLSRMQILNANGEYVSVVEISDGTQYSIKNIVGGRNAIPHNTNVNQYLDSIPVSAPDFPSNLSPTILQGRIFQDLLSMLKDIGSMRETTKTIQVNTIQTESQVDPRGANLINLMDTMFTNEPERYSQVEKYCIRLFPDIETIRPKRLVNNQLRVVVKKKNISYPIYLEYVGTGIDQLIIIIWKIATSNENTIWFIDEPELHVHPGAQKLLYDFLREETERGKQILIATHSMVFMYKSQESETTVIVERDGYAKFLPLNKLVDAEKESRRVSTERIRSLVYEALGYDPTMSFEPKTVVMVEGKTDELVLKEFSKTLGHTIDDRSTLFLPVGDKTKVEQFSPIITYALMGKKSYVILDNDNETPEKIQNKLPKVFITLNDISYVFLCFIGHLCFIPSNVKPFCFLHCQ